MLPRTYLSLLLVTQVLVKTVGERSLDTIDIFIKASQLDESDKQLVLVVMSRCTTPNVEQLLIMLHKKTYGIVVVQESKFTGHTSIEQDKSSMSKKADVVLIPVFPCGQFEFNLTGLQQSTAWTPRARHVLWAKDPDSGITKAVLQELWQRNVLRVLTVDTREFKIWRRSFAPESRCRYASDAISQQQSLSFQTSDHKMCRFWKEELMQVSGCLIKLAVFPYTPYAIQKKGSTEYEGGVDIKIIHTISENLNFSVVYLTPDITQAGEMLVNGSADIILGGVCILDEFYPSCDPTDTYWSEPMFWFVPAGLPIPLWLSVFFVFSWELWVYLFLVTIIVTIVSAILDRPGRSFQEILKSISFIRTLHVLLCGSASSPSKRLGTRMLFLTWIIGCFVLSSAYQSALMGFLMNPGSYRTIDSVEELANSSLLIGALPIVKKILEKYSDPAFEKILKRLVYCKDMGTCLDRVAFQRDMAVPIDKTYVLYEYSGSGTQFLKPVALIGTNGVLMFLSKNHPLLETVNKRIRGLMELGFVVKWLRDVTNHSPWAAVPTVLVPHSTVLAMRHVQGAIGILVLGWLAAAVAFVAEICLKC